MIVEVNENGKNFWEKRPIVLSIHSSDVGITHLDKEDGYQFHSFESFLESQLKKVVTEFAACLAKNGALTEFQSSLFITQNARWHFHVFRRLGLKKIHE